MTRNELKKFLKQDLFNSIQDRFRYDVSLSKISWMGVGGEATAVFKPKNIEEISFFLKNFPFKENIYVIGLFSNVIVRDGGINGVIIRLSGDFNEVKLLTKNTIQAGAMVTDAKISQFALENNLSNFEFLNTIPGTIGGNIKMNAGCYGNEVSDIIQHITAIDKNGNIVHIDDTSNIFSYRTNNLPKDYIFLQGIFQGRKEARNEILKKMEEMTKKRNNSQPIKDKTSGSTFANPNKQTSEKSAWQLIDEVGLRGKLLGGACFSEKHCNFLINNGTAKAIELEALGDLAKNLIKEKFNINLEWEVKRIGDLI